MRERLRIGHVPIDVVTFPEAVEAVFALVDAGAGGTVFTPNIDHVVLAEDDARFREAYARASLSLADGFPIVVTSKLMKTPLPAKISGSDITEPIVRTAAERGKSVYLLGAAPGVAQKAADVLVDRYPSLRVAGVASPTVRVGATAEELADVVAALHAAKPDLVLVAMGAPKQEILCETIREAIAPAVLLAIGATLDFIAGTVQRAPAWMSENGLEWAYRLAHEPRRLFHRYVIRDSRYPWIVARQALGRHPAKS